MSQVICLLTITSNRLCCHVRASCRAHANTSSLSPALDFPSLREFCWTDRQTDRHTYEGSRASLCCPPSPRLQKQQPPCRFALCYYISPPRLIRAHLPWTLLPAWRCGPGAGAGLRSTSFIWDNPSCEQPSITANLLPKWHRSIDRVL